MIFYCLSLSFSCLFMPAKGLVPPSYDAFCHNADSIELVHEAHSQKDALDIVNKMDSDVGKVKCYMLHKRHQI